ncbi:amidase [Jannaschia sp. LMIT008]|uniref:amidase n=1 Tax=Jannaschia maritima TaxID=3032585 RepID=UPI0028116178|nr:amidase [Jannaschia sp. LMIT008]
MTAAALSRAVRDRTLSCVAVMEAALDRIDARNPDLNAIVSLRPRADLMAEAAARDADLDAGRWRGALHGMPLAPKDLADTAGLRTTYGSPLHADHVPGADGIGVARMRAAGGIVIGKTNVPEWGLGSQTHNPVFGTTRNPRDPRLTPGGSSGGAAAALAAGMLWVADGSDLMGSLRNPAGWCGVWGLRPSFGLVPSGPRAEVFGHQMSTEGPMARNAGDLTLLLDALAGPDPRLPLGLAAPGRAIGGRPVIGWIGDWNGYLGMEDGVLDVCARALAATGWDVEPVLPAFDPARLWRAWIDLRSWSVAGGLAAAHADPAARALLKPDAVWEVERGLGLRASDIHRAFEVRSDWHRALLTLFERYDVLALPTAQVFAFDADIPWPRAVAGRAMDSYHRWMEVVVPGSMSVCPVLAMPAGTDAAGRHIGVQLIGPPGRDRELIAMAGAVR